MDDPAAPFSYPVFLDLRQRRCVVIGGDAMAAAKARELCAAGARVVVIAELPDAGIEELARGARLQLRRRAYRDGDLAGAFLAIAAGDDAAERDAVWREASRRGVPLNSVDDPLRCSFIAGAVARRGALTIAISTGGRAPALAVRLREWLEGELGAEHGRFLDLAATVREPLARRHPELALRRELWYRLVDSDALDLLRRGDDAGARRRFEEILGVAPAGVAAAAAPVAVAPAVSAAPAALPATPAAILQGSRE